MPKIPSGLRRKVLSNFKPWVALFSLSSVVLVGLFLFRSPIAVSQLGVMPARLNPSASDIVGDWMCPLEGLVVHLNLLADGSYYLVTPFNPSGDAPVSRASSVMRGTYELLGSEITFTTTKMRSDVMPQDAQVAWVFSSGVYKGVDFRYTTRVEVQNDHMKSWRLTDLQNNPRPASTLGPPDDCVRVHPPIIAGMQAESRSPVASIPEPFADIAVKVIATAVKRNNLYASQRVECLTYSSGDPTSTYVDIEVRERHDEACPGDSETSPRLDTFRVIRTGLVILWQDTLGNGDFVPYETFLSRRIALSRDTALTPVDTPDIPTVPERSCKPTDERDCDLVNRLLNVHPDDLGSLPTQLSAMPQATIARPTAEAHAAARSINQVGLDYFKARRFFEAADRFKRANSMDGSDEEILNNVGYAYLMGGNLGEAEKWLDRAVMSTPSRSYAWRDYANLKTRQNSTDVAAKALAIAYLLKPQDAMMKIFTADLSDTQEDKTRATVVIENTRTLLNWQSSHATTPSIGIP